MPFSLTDASQLRRYDQADLGSVQEDFVSTPRDEIVDGVGNRTRQEKEQSSKANPHAIQSPDDMDRCRRAHENAAVSGQDDKAVRQSYSLSGRNEGLEGLSSQRRKSKLAFADVLPDDETHSPVAKPARSST